MHIEVTLHMAMPKLTETDFLTTAALGILVAFSLAFFTLHHGQPSVYHRSTIGLPTVYHQRKTPVPLAMAMKTESETVCHWPTNKIILIL